MVKIRNKKQPFASELTHLCSNFSLTVK